MRRSLKLSQIKHWNRYFGASCGPAGKESACNVGDLGSIPGLGRSLEEGKKTHFSIVTWRIPWTEEPGKQNPWGHKDLDMTEAT